MLLHVSQREIISKEKDFIEQSRVTHLSCRTNRTSSDMTPTASESTTVGNTPTSSKLQLAIPKGPCEAVIVNFDKAVDNRSIV